MQRFWMKLFGVSAIALSAAAWVVPAHSTPPANGSPVWTGAMMDGGMMGGGIMGGGMMRGYNGNPQQGSADLDSPPGRLYAQTCAQCHALPDPRQHTGEQWPGVAARMERYMRNAHLPLPGKQDITDIDMFLARHSGRRR